MQLKYVKKRYLLLTRIWSSPGAFADLPRSVADAAEFFRAEEGSSTEKLFWSQYLAPEHLVPFSDQLKQLVELHRVAELAMKELIIRLWPAKAMPSSYFGLVKWLVKPALGLMPSSGRSASKVHGWPSPVSRYNGRRWTPSRSQPKDRPWARSTACPSGILKIF